MILPCICCTHCPDLFPNCYVLILLKTSEFWKRNLVSSTSFGSFGSYPLPLGLSKTGKAGSKGKGGKAGSKGKAGKAGSKGKGGKAVLAGALGSKTGSTKAPKSGKAGGSKGVHAGELGSKTGPSKAPMNGKAGSGKAGGGKGGKGSPVELDEPPRPLRADHKKTGKAGSSKV